MALFIIPTPISENIKESIPDEVIKKMHSIKYFIVERARTARRYIKASGYKGEIEGLTFFELDKRDAQNIPDEYLIPALEGNDMGLMSEAGMPGIADPGAMVISKAHELGIEVKPLTGPSSIFLALAASGMNGQNFTFDGYLPVKTPELKKKLQFIEKDILTRKTTHIFIETPYRNNRIIETITNSLNGKIKFCIASEITGENEYIQTKSIAQWKKIKAPDLHKKTCIFLLGI
ncbi:MAG TPA: SAM-dependent methyltransferase [Bacteroidetes bacterium]|nr:SAM-dependent methyltransferase [Bacteroidota bacterium]